MIVNPWFFYLMHVAEKLCVFFATMAFMGFSVVAGCFMFLSFENGADTYAAKQCRRAIKIALPVAIVGSVGMIFVPTEDTLLMMQAARLATTDNVNAVFEALKNAIDYAVGVLR